MCVRITVCHTPYTIHIVIIIFDTRQDVSPKDEPVLVRGNLQKLGKRFKGWHQRYFEIQGSHMYYYKNATVSIYNGCTVCTCSYCTMDIIWVTMTCIVCAAMIYSGTSLFGTPMAQLNEMRCARFRGSYVHIWMQPTVSWLRDVLISRMSLWGYHVYIQACIETVTDETSTILWSQV